MREALSAAKERSTYLEGKLKTQQNLYSQGLITKGQVQSTKQDVQSAREDMDRLRSQLRQTSLSELEAKGQKEAELRASDLQIQEAKRSVALLQERLELSSRVVSTRAGRVLEVRAKIGDMIRPGSAIVNLELEGDASAKLEVIIYVPAAEGKKVQPGMEVQISPSTVRQEEHGVVLAEVRAVSDFPATRKGMMRLFDNEELVDSFLRLTGGTPIRIRGELIVDATTESGYRWSSPKGAPVELTSGTPCAGSITIKRQRPIALVIPIVREGLGI